MKKGYPISLSLQTNPVAESSVTGVIALAKLTTQLWRNRRLARKLFIVCSR